MAVSTGVGPHQAWISVDGGMFPVLHGSVTQNGSRQSSTFHVTVPLSYPGAEDVFSELGGNETTLMVMTRGEPALLLTGETDTVTIDYVARTVNASGRCKSAKLHEKKSAEKWTNKQGHEIVQELAGRVGLGVQADSSKLMAGKKVKDDFAKMTDGISYAAVIHRLSEFDGARWWVDAQGILNYKALGSMSGNYTIAYQRPGPGPMRADFLSLHVSRNIQAGKTLKATVDSWHPKQKKVNTGTHTVGGKGGEIEYKYDIPNLEQSHAQQYAEARVKEHASRELSVHCTVVGDPSINVAMGLTLIGTGHFDQSYQMESISHQFGIGGHTMSIHAKSASQGRNGSGGGGG